MADLSGSRERVGREIEKQGRDELQFGAHPSSPGIKVRLDLG